MPSDFLAVRASGIIRYRADPRDTLIARYFTCRGQQSRPVRSSIIFQLNRASGWLGSRVVSRLGPSSNRSRDDVG